MAYRHRRTTGGFTLLEVLVVIGLIGLLAGLVIVALPRVTNTANEAATRATITKVNELLNKRLAAIQRELDLQDERTASEFEPPEYVEAVANTRSWPLDDGLNAPATWSNVATREQARILARKAFVQRHLPQTYAEAVEVDGSVFDYALPGLTSGSAEVFNWSPAATDTTVTAELLYHILTHGEAFGVEVLEERAFNAGEIADTENEDINRNGTLDPGEDVNGNGVLDVDGDGLPEIVDAWGNPLRFYRWPTRLIRPAAPGSESNPQTITNPMDPENALEYALKIDPAFTILEDSVGVIAGANARTLITAIDVSPANGPLRGYAGPPPTFGDETGVAGVPTQPGDPLAVDPDDPTGRLHAQIVTERAGPTTLLDFYNSLPPIGLHDPDTWHAVLVVSAGTDGRLGLFEPVDVTNYGHLAQPDFSDNGERLLELLDNITNRQQ